jgi:murein L,D-transpeptidase YafK
MKPISRLVSAWLAMAALWPAVAGAELVANTFFSNVDREEVVVVEKNSRKVYVVRADGNRPEVVDRFSVMVGENAGDKIKEGDKRTPEGVYYVQNYIPNDRLARLYGAGAFPLNYPNIVDRIQDKTGYGIWLHGRDESDKDKTATNGCVAFDNQGLNHLKGMLEVGTPVVITKQARFLDPAAYDQRRQVLLGTLHDFLAAWENSDFAAFARYLHDNFRSSSGEDRQAFLQSKRNLMEVYPEREVDADHIRVFRENGRRVVYDFNQFYCAPNITAYGRKRLYFKRQNGKMRLLAEEFFPRSAWPEIRERIDGFVEDWRTAWQSEDLDDYLDHYGAGFEHRGRDKAAFRAYKERVFARRKDMHVAVKNLRIHQVRPNHYVVGFDQRFDSAGYSDYGVKRLELAGCPGNLRIVGETWRPLP